MCAYSSSSNVPGLETPQVVECEDPHSVSVGPERQVDPVTADQLRVANLHFDRSPEKDGSALRTFRFATPCAWARRSQFSGAEPLFGAVLPHEKHLSPALYLDALQRVHGAGG